MKRGPSSLRATVQSAKEAILPHKDIPSRQDIEALASVRTPYCVSIYLPTGTGPADSERAKIELKNHFTNAKKQLETVGAPKSACERLDDVLDELLGNSLFWSYQSQSLAVLVNEDITRIFRLPNRFVPTLDVADRFYMKPLMRTITFSQSAYVLALSQKSVRLIRVTADQPAELVEVDGLPTDMESFLNLDLDSSGRNAEDRGELDPNVWMQQYTAAVNKAIYPAVRESKLPLILAAADPLASFYRRSNSYKYLSETGIPGNSEALSADALADKVRPILDDLYKEEVAGVIDRFKTKQAQGLGTSDLSTAARGAVMHAIDTLLIDFDKRIPGYIDEAGVIQPTAADDASNYGIADEILRHALLVNARVYAVRSDEMPDGAEVAATFRFPPA